MFIGPIILIIIKNVFSNFFEQGIVKTILKTNWNKMRILTNIKTS